MLNPLNTNKLYLRLYFGVWVAILCSHAVIIYFIWEPDWAVAWVDSFTFNLLFSFIGFGIWYIVSYARLDTSNVLNTVISHLAASVILISIWLYAGRTALLLVFKDDTEYISFLGDTTLWRGIIGFLYYTIIAFGYYLIQYYKEYQDQLLRESEINRLLKETELSALKSQINPHFIFNSLNSISSLTLSKPEKAHEMVLNLSAFLRYMITPTSKQLIKLSEELKAVKLYLEIEQVRFGEKLKVEFNCEEESQDLKLPQLILQPLVENAVKYGVYESTEKNSIKINCKKTNGFLAIEVQNDIEKGGVPLKGQGIGLKNVRSRLELVYDNPELLIVEKTDSRFSVKLTFPQ